MASAGGERSARRRGKRAARLETPQDLGVALRKAREDKGVGLPELHDRTGLTMSYLEALEDGDLLRFPDERAASIAVRRYGEVLQLDVQRLQGVVHENWKAGVVQAGNSPTAAAWAQKTSGPGATSTGHLTRFPGDRSHLEAFTQTAETVPVRGGARAKPGGDMLTGAYPAVPPLRIRPARRRPPLILRLTLWTTLALIVVGGAGLAIDHWRPQLLKDIHVLSGPPAKKSHSSQGQGSSTQAPQLVSSTSTGPSSEQMTVKAANYQVVVKALAPAWIEVSSPASSSPLFENTLQTGEQQAFDSTNGALTVEFGGAQAISAVEIDGHAVANSLFKPPVVPFTLNFKSVG